MNYYAQSDTIHQSIYDLIHSEDRDELRRQLDWAAFLRAHNEDPIAATCAAAGSGLEASAHGSDQQTSSGRSRGHKETRDQKQSKSGAGGRSGSGARAARSAQPAPNSLPEDPLSTLNSGVYCCFFSDFFYIFYLIVYCAIQVQRYDVSLMEYTTYSTERMF